MTTPLMDLIGDFKPGSIRRIRLRNFLTYTHVEFNPGPRLNIVCGPNGCGKSTLLCAICLGLGGEPKTLGRSDDARNFIMNEQETAEIEIELEPFPDREAHVIRRIIDRSKGSKHGHGRGASTFFINHKEVTAKSIHQLVTETYSIFVDNLCTFLPQERVGNFSALSPHLLLEETEKVLSKNQELYHEHQRLIDLEARIDDGNNNLGTLQAKLKHLEEENARLEREKERMEERERAIQQAKLYRMKLLWLRFDEARDAAIVLKQQRAQALTRLNDAKRQVEPLENNHSLICLQKQKAVDRLELEETNCRALGKSLTTLLEKHEKHDETVEDLLAQVKHLRGNRERRRQDLETARLRLDKLEATIKGYPPRREIVAEYDDAALAKRSGVSIISHTKRNLGSHQQQLRDAEDSARRIQEKLRKLNDDKARRNERIFQLEPKLREVYEWLNQNRARFRRQVWGPIVCEVTTNSQVAATFLEQHVPNVILKAFVVECRDDFDLLYKLVRQGLGIAINIQIIVDGKLEASKRLYSERKMDLLKRQHGITGYLDETFTAPDAVMEALKTWAQVQDVLVGNEVTQRSIDREKLLDFLTEPDPSLGQTRPLNACIFASEHNKSYKYTASISRYSQKAIIRVDEINPARWLAPGVNPTEKATAEEEHSSAAKTIDRFRRLVQECEAKLSKEQVEVDAVMTRFNEAKLRKDELEKILVKISNAKVKLRDAEAALRNAQDDAEKRQLYHSLKSHVANSILSLESHAELHSQLIQSTLLSAAIRIKKESLLVAERQAREKLDEMRQALNEFQRDYSEVVAKFVRTRDEVRRLQVEAERDAPLVDINGHDLPIKAKLDGLEATTIEEAEAALDEATAKANSIDDNPDVVRQYEQRQEEIETLQNKLQLAQGSRERKAKELKKLLEPWERKLSKSLMRASVLFSNYMAELGCAGEVAINKGEGGPEQERRRCKDWGVEIKVKFRDKSKLQVLSAQIHSGGERSVSTIMYLMALQELMVNPFRCVDEINQGLDERNERLVFKRIVTNSTRKPKTSATNHSGQYFLITPKLLPNLTDMEQEGVTVLTIFNGHYCFTDPNDWDVKRFVELRTKHRPVKPCPLMIKTLPAVAKPHIVAVTQNGQTAVKESPIAMMRSPRAIGIDDDENSGQEYFF